MSLESRREVFQFWWLDDRQTEAVAVLCKCLETFQGYLSDRILALVFYARVTRLVNVQKGLTSDLHYRCIR